MTEAEEMNEIVIKDMAGHQIGHWSEDMVETIKNTVAKNATHTELQLFAQVCNESGLNPFMKEIWFVKYGENEPAIMTGRDGYLKIAESDPNFLGVQSFSIYEKDEFRVQIRNGKVADVIHDFGHVGRGNLVGAWAVAEKQGKKPVYAYVKLDEFIQYKKDGQVNKFWKTKPDTMIKKVAEADVLKRISSITGLNVAETMSEEYSSNFINADYSVKDDNDRVFENINDHIATPKQTTPEQPKHKHIDSVTGKDMDELKNDELAEENYLKVKKALQQTNKEITTANVEQKAKWFAKNPNHVQFNEDMIDRVMKIAERELGVTTEPDPVEPENVQEAEFSKKNNTESVIDSKDLETPEQVYDRAVTRVKAKNFKVSEKNIKLQAVNLLNEAGIEVKPSFIDSVMELAKADTTS